MNHLLHHFREQSTLPLSDCVWMRFKFWSCQLLPGKIKFSMVFTLNLLCAVFCQILAFSSPFWTFFALPKPFKFIAVAVFHSVIQFSASGCTACTYGLPQQTKFWEPLFWICVYVTQVLSGWPPLCYSNVSPKPADIFT